jgi:hypothetical protein
MRKSILYAALLLGTSVGLPAVAVAQSAPAGDVKASAKYDPKDFSGVWVTKREQGVSIIDEKKRPAVTPLEQMKYDAAFPTVGPRAQPGKDNDPTLWCAPDGIPKIFTSPEPFEIFVVPGRWLEVFEKDHNERQIWADGRKLPDDPDPTWYGTSVGHWDGNDFVVESKGFNDGTWLDYPGNQHTDAMQLTERYHRVDADTMTIQITITDPKSYTAPWVNPPKTFTKHADWELKEWYCTPSEEEKYDETIRYKAGVAGSGPPPEHQQPAPQK